MMINNVKARKMLSKWCTAYLAHIVNKSEEVVLGVKDTLMMQEFLDVFLNSLSKVALERGIKFSIKFA